MYSIDWKGNKCSAKRVDIAKTAFKRRLQPVHKDYHAQAPYSSSGDGNPEEQKSVAKGKASNTKLSKDCCSISEGVGEERRKISTVPPFKGLKLATVT